MNTFKLLCPVDGLPVVVKRVRTHCENTWLQICGSLLCLCLPVESSGLCRVYRSLRMLQITRFASNARPTDVGSEARFPFGFLPGGRPAGKRCLYLAPPQASQQALPGREL